MAAGKPAINTIQTNLDGSYRLTGTLLNGISEGAAYGDDAQMNSNYPLVRLTDATGRVYYARTRNWSSTGVNTGTNIESTDFVLPANFPAGIYGLVVVANGIASDPMRFIYSPDVLLVTPGTSFTFSGAEGGPFDASATVLTLTNIGATSLNWSLGNTQAWLSVSAQGGTLTPGGAAASVTVSLTAAASSLMFGTYTVNLMITNLSDHVVQTRQFNLQVNPPQLVQNGGFETGDFTDWTLVGDGYNFDFVDDGTYFSSIQPHSGNYFALMGEANFEATLTQNLGTTPGQTYLLSLWMDSPDGFNPNEFSVMWNGTTLYDGVNLPALGWTNLQFLVTATANSTPLQMGFRDDVNYLGMDDVSVTAVRAPTVQSVVKTGGDFSITWTAMLGLAYQLQYKTNLTQANWINAQTPLTAHGRECFRDGSCAGRSAKILSHSIAAVICLQAAGEFKAWAWVSRPAKREDRSHSRAGISCRRRRVACRRPVAARWKMPEVAAVPGKPGRVRWGVPVGSYPNEECLQYLTQFARF